MKNDEITSKASTIVSKRPKVYSADLALKAIRELIISGYLKPNQQIIEAEIARKLGMSRTPIRTAIFKLEILGYVDRLSSRSATVATYDAKKISDFYDTREVLSTMAVKLACGRISQEAITQATKYLEESIETIANREFDRIPVLTNAFHNQIIDACGNNQLSFLLNISNGQCFEAVVMRKFTDAEWNRIIKYHGKLLEALRTNNTKMAVAAIHGDIKLFKKVGIKYM